MPQTRWNKGQTILNADAYNLAGDLATQSDTLNVITPVASDTEETGLTPPQGKYAGMIDVRTDKPGLPLKVYDGTAWRWGARVERTMCSTTDTTWAYNVVLHRTTEPNGSQMVSMGLIVARTGGGAFSCPTNQWTLIFSGLIPAGWRPNDSVHTCGAYDFMPGTGAVLLKIDQGGNIFGQGVTGSVSMGNPTKVSASANWSI